MKELSTYIDNQALRDYEPGTFDCCTFANGCIETIAGSSPIMSVGNYTRFSMRKVVGDYGSLENAVSFAMGCKPICMDNALNGWPVLINTLSVDHDGAEPQAQQSIAVYFEGELIAPHVNGGLSAIPLRMGLKTWRP